MVLIRAAHFHDEAEKRRYELLEIIVCKACRGGDFLSFSHGIEHGLASSAFIAGHIV